MAEFQYKFTHKDGSGDGAVEADNEAEAKKLIAKNLEKCKDVKIEINQE